MVDNVDGRTFEVLEGLDVDIHDCRAETGDQFGDIEQRVTIVERGLAPARRHAVEPFQGHVL